ncbi:ABC transporter ATP-binding protein [Mumia sp. DW29H23]|uniref:ABC transporter ATP-binding protein n=1 Tax=Mumia sp. DW29H23 TaxID=3421241 RepID=UPI003D690F05
MPDTAISVSGLSKDYRIARTREHHSTAAEAALARLRHPLERAHYDVFPALDDLTFDIGWGEAVGVIGRNGAGKSTLLKILTRITAPTRGRIELGGRVGSLLEVGTGFHPELTGRENVYLNGTLLGMRKKEISRRFEEIVDFAGVEQFLDTPVKRYSSGMYIRLAFAVAAHLETEILAVDEVLAVGDAEFQQKCLGKMREVARSGRTVLLVSHQVQTVMSLCTSAIYLQNGRLLEHGPVSAAMEHYKRSFEQSAMTAVEAARRSGSGELRFSNARMTQEVVEPAEEKVVEFTVGANPDFVGTYFVSAELKNSDGTTVLQCDSRLLNFWLDAKEDVRGTLRIGSPWLKPDSYTVDLFLCKNGVIDAWEGACAFQVMPILPYPEATSDDGTQLGVVFGDFSYKRG